MFNANTLVCTVPAGMRPGPVPVTLLLHDMTSGAVSTPELPPLHFCYRSGVCARAL